MNKHRSLLVVSFLCFFLISCEPWNLEKKTFPVCTTPAAKITLTITNLTVNFDLSNLKGPVTEIYWDFGDGNSFNKATGFSYSYKNQGSYTIKVQVFNECRDITNYSFNIAVSTVPVATTLDNLQQEDESLLLSMNVLNSGNALISEYGICLSNNLPYTSIELGTVNSVKNNPALNTSYSFRFTKLMPNTTYYYNAFAKNPFGVGYGQIKKTNTMPANTPKGIVPIFPLELTGRENTICFTIGKTLYTGMGVDSDGKLYNDLWEYDTQKNTWTARALFPSTARASAISFTLNGKGYVGLGSNGNTFFNDFWEYDSRNNIWTKKTDFPSSARQAAFSISNNNIGYVGGGTANGKHFRDFWQYDPSRNSWQQRADLPLYKINGSGFSIGNYLYMGFGQNMSSANATTTQNGQDFWQYSPSANIWLRKLDIPSDISFDTKINFTINGKGYIGRFDKDFPDLLKMYFYTPETNKWDLNNGFLAIPRYNACAGVIDNVGYYGFGGSNKNLLKDFWLFKP